MNEPQILKEEKISNETFKLQMNPKFGIPHLQKTKITNKPRILKEP